MLDTNEKRGVPAGSRGARREAGGAAPFARRPGPRRAGGDPRPGAGGPNKGARWMPWLPGATKDATSGDTPGVGASGH